MRVCVVCVESERAKETRQYWSVSTTCDFNLSINPHYFPPTRASLLAHPGLLLHGLQRLLGPTLHSHLSTPVCISANLLARHPETLRVVSPPSSCEALLLPLLLTSILLLLDNTPLPARARSSCLLSHNSPLPTTLFALPVC